MATLLVVVMVLLQARPVHALYIKQYGGTVELPNANSNKCLDVTGQGTGNGSPIQQWDCWHGNNQLWQVVQFDDLSIELVGQGSGRCLDDTGYSQSQGTQFQIYDCTWNTNERFYKQNPLGWGCDFWVNLLNNMVIDVRALSQSNGAVVQQWPYNGGYNQCWTGIP